MEIVLYDASNDKDIIIMPARSPLSMKTRFNLHNVMTFSFKEDIQRRKMKYWQ